MKIIGDITKIPKIFNKQKSYRVQEKPVSISSGKDELSISGAGKDFQTVLKTLRDVPEIREDKVKELKDKISSGTYNPSGKQIADKIVDSIINRRI